MCMYIHSACILKNTKGSSQYAVKTEIVNIFLIAIMPLKLLQNPGQCVNGMSHMSSLARIWYVSPTHKQLK